MFFLGTRKKQEQVSRLLCRLINQHSMARLKIIDRPRLEERFDLNTGVWVAPCVKGEPLIDQTFRGLTKNLCSSGVGLFVDHFVSYDELLVRLPIDEQTHFLRTQVVQRTPLGAGYYLLGLKVEEIIAPADVRKLDELDRLLLEHQADK